ncbi:hypothetical protein EKG38_19855 [Shewanella canadensis]|uniref:Uncharacterized protein n=1 Tax=Shewanella canadensis TaxID=271096 RepID=A0A431WP45_9GAMM|nr:hypothetical protein [Shewanella canadensis]RTR37191.1 hypothetical protein EKG38_19855 [Shewanella canadensis]
MKQLPRRVSSIMLIALIAFISGCSTLPLATSSEELKVNATELGNYWLVENGALDWSALLNGTNGGSSFSATFTINTQGQIENLNLEKIAGDFKTDKQMHADFSKQTFIATKTNYLRQAVTITALVN